MSSTWLKIIIMVPPNADESMDMQRAIVDHLAKGLNLDQQDDKWWENDIGVVMTMAETGSQYE